MLGLEKSHPLVPESRLHMLTFCGVAFRLLGEGQALFCSWFDGASLLVWSNWHFQWYQPSEDRTWAIARCPFIGGGFMCIVS